MWSLQKEQQEQEEARQKGKEVGALLPLTLLPLRSPVARIQSFKWVSKFPQSLLLTALKSYHF